MGVGLLHQFIPGYSVFDMSSSLQLISLNNLTPLFFQHLLDLIPVGFHSIIFLSFCFLSPVKMFPSFYPVLYVFISPPLINFSSSSLFIFYPSSVRTAPQPLLNISFKYKHLLHSVFYCDMPLPLHVTVKYGVK